jgi:mRNA degradation ribonuclease J1/J2
MAALRAQGKTYAQIAEATGRNKIVVSRHMQKKKIKALIEAVQQDLMSETLQDAADIVKMAIKNYKNPAKEIFITKKGEKVEVIDKQLRDHGFKAAMAMMQGIGVTPSASQATYVQNIYNDNRRVEIPQEIQEFLKARRAEVAIPAEYEEIT